MASRFPITTGATVLDGLSAGWSIPAEYYTDEQIFERELELIFGRSWVFGGHVRELSEPGARIVFPVGRTQVVLRRDTDGSLRAARADDPHAQARVATWGPLVFANLDMDAPPLETTLGDIPGMDEQRGIDLASFPFARRRVTTIDCNWKLVVENSAECYHCETVHRGFAAVCAVEDASVTVESGQPSYSVLVPMREQPMDFLVHWVWPSMAVLIDPGNGYFTYQARPVDASSTEMVEEYYFRADLTDAELEEQLALHIDACDEDAYSTVSVQRGLASRLLPQCRLFVGQEDALLRIQRFVYETLEGAQ